VLADEDYLRESIVKPDAKIVAGYQPIMPTFQGQLSEEELIELIAFIKGLGPGQTPKRVDTAPQPIESPQPVTEPGAKSDAKSDTKPGGKP
jgi:cytochrome c oxidase subunit II